jgi:uncharacterized protein
VTRILSDNFRNVDISDILELILARSEIVQPASFSDWVYDDPDDDKFLTCALASGAMIIVSGDKHLLRISGFREITVMNPRIFVEKFL